ncbi:MAG: HAD family phosphatase [Nitrospiraceae bacterium]|nr:MAG: HAD family phosphatase [Nitrospiraceae bacterium]
MIKAIIFDYGNVISAVLNGPFLGNLARLSGKTIEELDESIHAKSSLLKDFETGRISPDKFFGEAVRLGGITIEKREFKRLFTGRFSPIASTHDLIRKLKPAFRLALLSNTNEWDYEHEIKKSAVFSLFDAVTVSCRVGAMKPDERIYRDALEKLNLRPSDCIYIDDIKDYADAASAEGMRGIHYQSHEGLLESLNNLHICP